MMRGAPLPLEILYGGGVALACGNDGVVLADELTGLFAGDTRVLSTYRLSLAGHAWQMLSRTRPGPSTAQWEMQNTRVRAPDGDLAEGVVYLRLRRQVQRALHDCLRVEKFGVGAAHVRLVLQLDADFADIFEVKARSTPPRLDVQRYASPEGVTLLYQRPGFARGLRVILHGLAGAENVLSHVGSQLVFDLSLGAGKAFQVCLEACPIVDGRVFRFGGEPHVSEELIPEAVGPVRVHAESRLARPFARAQADLVSLVMSYDGASFVAAGAPWFMALFGRDTLVTSLMTGILGPQQAEGALAALAALQATARDDFRDAEPGKLPHELREGELTHFGRMPHSPYYGTHDAPALYVLTLWQLWRWTGDRALVDRFLPAARRALEWCARLGDRDGDGLLEYETRSPAGYRNQSWKDAGTALVNTDGTLVETPIATVELQGYWFAALLAMAELDEARADELRAQAAALRARVEQIFWLEEAGTYAFALDGHKRRVESVASNPGHLLWCGLPSPARAARLTERLLRPDLASGYGLRTLSAAHRAYNPLSYQNGSVWPHDTLLAAAGMFRYGLRAEGARLVDDLLEAATGFEHARLPELFAGFSREEGRPVPYAEANSPQAWAAAAPVLAVQLFLGLQPDLPRGRCFLAPWLPEWLPSLRVTGIPVRGGALDVTLERRGAETRVASAHAPGLELVRGTPPAPLGGAPVAP